VLADGGIVCIDEFDKMKPADRVAIHEAMEQQTISVAKAGITTRLNSRTSVLAAANPIFGKFDDMKVVEEQIELQSTILSRFDCIFIVRDINNPETNERIASHILDMHQGKSMKNSESVIPFDTLKKYIKYAKTKIQPRLSIKASEDLINQYVNDRQKSYEQAKMRKTANGIPITVRQLEAVIRLS
jgi:DNA replication licensing factor MCM5